MKKKILVITISTIIIIGISLLLIINKNGVVIKKISKLNSFAKNYEASEKLQEEEEGILPIKISYSDLSIDQKIASITKIADTKEKKEVTGDGKLAKTEISRKKDETTKVKIEYELTIANEGNSEGTIENIIVNMPEGMELSQESSSTWKKESANTLEYNNKEEIKEGENKKINLTIEGTASENMGEQKAEAMIISSEDADQRIVENETNKKIDKTNVKQNMEKTNNYSSASALISINTWLKDYSIYLIILLTILIIIGIIMYKKKEES